MTVTLDHVVPRPIARRRWLRMGSLSFRFGVVALALFVLAAVFAPLLSPYDPIAVDVLNTLKPPSLAHPFGLTISDAISWPACSMARASICRSALLAWRCPW